MEQSPTPADPAPDQLSEWVDVPAAPAPASKSGDPGQYVCTIPALSWMIVVASLAPLAGGYLLVAGRDLEWILGYTVVCAIIGIMETLAATAWGAMIAMTESGRAGSLFVVLPPYMIYYAATRWRWMAQPSVLFLSGLGLAFGGIFAGRHLLDAR